MSAPRAVLQHDSVAVGILEGLAGYFPVRIERRHGHEAMCGGALARGFPFRSIGQVEDDQVLGCGRRRDRMIRAVREFEVIVETVTSEHHAGKAVVIVETREDRQVEGVAIHALGAGEVADRAGNTQMGVQDDLGEEWRARSMISGPIRMA